MVKRLHAVFDGEVLRSEETVIIKQDEPKSRNLWSVFTDLAGKIEGPPDWSEEHDHYLYGTPNRKQG
ncbi:hypothetical protein KKE26_00415 [bacterium]|nr:hypothetical protein [bacterium]MBU1753745.1 hypothetical protein [bacterium]